MSAPSIANIGLDSATAHRSKGETSRETILHTAARLATVKGINGLSIGDLAAEVGMSKSGIYAHFRNKEEMVLAVIDTAVRVYDIEVMLPAMKVRAGLDRLRALASGFLDHVERKVYPGGCFFVAVSLEVGNNPGPARDQVMIMLAKWLGALRQCVTDAQLDGTLDRQMDADQAVFEIESVLLSANFFYVMTKDAAHMQSARLALEHVLARYLSGNTA